MCSCDKPEGKATRTREPKTVRCEDLLEGERKKLLCYLHVCDGTCVMPSEEPDPDMRTCSEGNLQGVAPLGRLKTRAERMGAGDERTPDCLKLGKERFSHV